MSGERTIAALRLYLALAFGYAIVPFVWLLVEARGLGIADYAALQSIYYVSTLLAELPTGILADRHGRRFVLIAAGLVQAAGFSALALGRDFAAFAGAHVLLGIGQAMLSGTPAALLYDTLLARGTPESYLRLEAKNTLYRLCGSSAAFLAGGLVGKPLGFETAAWISAGLSTAAAGVAFLLAEPPHFGGPAVPAHPWDLLRSSLDSLWRDRALRWIALAFALLFVELRIAFHFYTPGLERAGVTDPASIGAAFAGLNVVAAVAARVTPRWLSNAPEAEVLIGLTGVVAFSFGLLAFSATAAVVFLGYVLQQIPFGVHFPVVNSLVNRRVTSSRRATVLSCLSLLGRAAFALAFPIVGFLVQRFGPSPAYVFVAVTSAAAACVLASTLRQVRSLSSGTGVPSP